MYYDDHNPPHLHARYGRAKAAFKLADGSVLRGELPPVATRMVREWTIVHRGQLEENWRRIVDLEKPEQIVGPDGSE